MRTLASNDIIDMIYIFADVEVGAEVSVDKIFGNRLFGHNLKLAC